MRAGPRPSADAPPAASAGRWPPRARARRASTGVGGVQPRAARRRRPSAGPRAAPPPAPRRPSVLEVAGEQRRSPRRAAPAGRAGTCVAGVGRPRSRASAPRPRASRRGARPTAPKAAANPSSQRSQDGRGRVARGDAEPGGDGVAQQRVRAVLTRRATPGRGTTTPGPAAPAARRRSSPQQPRLADPGVADDRRDPPATTPRRRRRGAPAGPAARVSRPTVLVSTPADAGRAARARSRAGRSASTT